MKKAWKEPETLLEAGLALFGLGLLAGIGVLVAGRSAGGMQHARRRARQAPQPGSVGPSRHQNVRAASAR